MDRCLLLKTKQAGDESQDYCKEDDMICRLVTGDYCSTYNAMIEFHEQKVRKFWAEKDPVS